MSAANDFGMIGLGVMGSNLLLNMADHGFSVTGYDKNAEKTNALEAASGNSQNVKGVNTLQQLVNTLKKPRKIMMLVPAGPVVDSVINEISPMLDSGDILIDGGNSHYTDTARRILSCKDKFHFIGIGISGGEQGARTGPSIMPGGDAEAFQHLQPILEAVAAKVDGKPCVAYLGSGAAGHFVKMVHNGIEYAIMQLLSECYDLLHNGFRMSDDQLHAVFKSWNAGPMNSFLMEITADIFVVEDDRKPGRLIDAILDKAGSKGTGKWTSQAALDLGVPIPVIDSAIMMRNISSLKDDRVKLSSLSNHPLFNIPSDKELFIEQLHNALLFATVISYAQGLALLQEASAELQMNIPMQEVVRVWSGGCIIRSALLPDFMKAYESQPKLSNILLNENIYSLVADNYNDAVEITKHAIANDYPVSALSSSVNYYNAFRRAELPVNLIQAQRDFFGAHTFQRNDMEGTFHNEWNTPSKPNDSMTQ